MNTSRLVVPPKSLAAQPLAHMPTTKQHYTQPAMATDDTATEAQRKAGLERRLAEEKARDESKAKRKKKDARGLF